MTFSLPALEEGRLEAHPATTRNCFCHFFRADVAEPLVFCDIFCYNTREPGISGLGLPTGGISKMAKAATEPINPITNRPYAKGYTPGTASGAITLAVRNSPTNGPILEATVRSFTRRGVRYLIEVNCTTGQCRCSCEACKRSIERHGGYPRLAAAAGYCKHIFAWWPQLAREVIEINDERLAEVRVEG